MPATPSPFAARLIAWQKRHGRHDLPWQDTKDPYRVWLSEIMLQQTQVATVIPYYQRFLARFPDLASLAAAPVDAVMAHWSGLGYYARARNLHACAQAVMAKHGGEFPPQPEAIAALPGIGRSTANAIAVFCFGARVAILDGNVKRLLARHAGIEGWPGNPAVESQSWRYAESLLPATEVDTYIQAQMDLGATICTRSKPKCESCPVAEDCVARRDERTAELPTAKPRKALPERETTMLVLIENDRVLLLPRPPTGIWGGLLSLPELATGRDAEQEAARLGCRIVSQQALAAVSHTFTHFRLTIMPLLCEVQSANLAAEPGARWLAAADLAQAPLPAPIRKLLAVLLDQPAS
ncbi:MAG: A/G-specific adenine glycosylase [Rhodocyclales bacterium]|nr:A/G-specific adenine glycosylase [Rhodocyclales bacterium]